MTFFFLLYKLPSNLRLESFFSYFIIFHFYLRVPIKFLIILSCDYPISHLRFLIMIFILRVSIQRQRQVRKSEIRGTLKGRHCQRYVRGYIDYLEFFYLYTRNPERLKCGRCTLVRHDYKVVSSLIIKETRANRNIDF